MITSGISSRSAIGSARSAHASATSGEPVVACAWASREHNIAVASGSPSSPSASRARSIRSAASIRRSMADSTS